MDGLHLVIHGVRGLEGEALKTVSTWCARETPARRVGALGGPVQEDELREGRPSAMVCGSRFLEVHAARDRGVPVGRAPRLHDAGSPGATWN